MIKLNLGCGMIRPKGWVNADSSINAMIQKWSVGKWISKKLKAVSFESSNVIYMNLNKRWSHIRDNSVNVVYSSHAFEHLETESAALFLEEAYRVLRPGGCIRLVMPDLYAHSKEYIKSVDEGKLDASSEYLKSLNLYRRMPGQHLSLTYKLMGWLQGFPHRHKYMYDQLLLTQLLTDQGFKEIKMGSYGHSEYVGDINDVEGPHLYGGYPNSIYIEALKA